MSALSSAWHPVNLHRQDELGQITAGRYSCRKLELVARIITVEDGICYGWIERGGRRIGSSEWSENGGKNAHRDWFDLMFRMLERAA